MVVQILFGEKKMFGRDLCLSISRIELWNICLINSAALLSSPSIQGLDFEKNSKYTLLVAVENEVPFAVRLPTATATVVVNVLDVNEAPVFDPAEKLVSKQEDLAVDSDVVQYTAYDPDTARKQKVM